MTDDCIRVGGEHVVVGVLHTNGSFYEYCSICGKTLGTYPKMGADKMEPKKEIVLIGGGNGAMIVQHILDCNMYPVKVVAIFDDDPMKIGTRVNDVPVIGSINYGEFDPIDVDTAVICISSNIPFRDRVFRSMKKRGWKFMNVVHPTAVISDRLCYGEGNIIGANVYVGPYTTLGNNNFLSACSSVEHHNIVLDSNLFGPGARTSGSVIIGSRNVFGANVSVMPKVRVGNDCSVASGIPVWYDLRDGKRMVWRGRLF